MKQKKVNKKVGGKLVKTVLQIDEVLGEGEFGEVINWG